MSSSTSAIPTTYGRSPLLRIPMSSSASSSPKGTDFSKLTDDEVQRVFGMINDRLRKVFRYRTASEVFREMLHSA